MGVDSSVDGSIWGLQKTKDFIFHNFFLRTVTTNGLPSPKGVSGDRQIHKSQVQTLRGTRRSRG
jgi:hypothetical protein